MKTADLPRLYQSLSQALENEECGAWGDAADEYRRLLEHDDQALACRAAIGLARCLLETSKRGETDQAEDLLHTAGRLVDELGDPELRGLLLLELGRFDDLSARRHAALERYTEARQLLGEAGADVVPIELTLAAAERRLGELNAALSRLEAINTSALAPRLRADYFDELGTVLLARGEVDRATSTLEAALSLDDQSGSEYIAGRSALLLAEAYIHTGKQERAKHLIDEAIKTYERANAAAALSDAYALLGAWYEDREDYGSAGHHYQLSLEYDKTSADAGGQVRAKRRLARTYRKRGDSRRAEELLDEAWRQLSHDDDFEKAALYREQGHLALTSSQPDYERAINSFEEALRIAVEDGDARMMAIAKRDLARAYTQRGDGDDKERAAQMLVEAREALEARGDLRELSDLLDDLGEVLLDKNDYPGAEHALEDALRLDEQLGRIAGKARTHILLGNVAVRQADPDAARKQYERARDLYRRADHDVGMAEAHLHLGQWHLDQGQLDKAVDHLQSTLELANRMNRAFDRARANRLLAATARLQGNLERADEYLDGARRDLGSIDDPEERALIEMEQGRLELDNGNYRAAQRTLEDARRGFSDTRNLVKAATCDRLLALALSYQGFYLQAFELLDQAKGVLEQKDDVPELDELYDDMGTVYLLSGQADRAADCVRRGLCIGERAACRQGTGRNFLLLAKIALAQADFVEARSALADAITAFKRTGNESGAAAAQIELGDWYVDEQNTERNLDAAVHHYKAARRVLQHNRHRRGVARANRKLAIVYLERHWLDRADEALEDAAAEVIGIDDPRVTAPLDLSLAKLAIAQENYGSAVQHLKGALRGFNSLSQDDHRKLAYQMLIMCYQAQGKMAEALELIRDAGAEHAAMYNALVKDLHPQIAAASEPMFRRGRYTNAIANAYADLERAFKERSRELPNPPADSEPVSSHIKAWISANKNVPQFSKPSTLDKFRDFCIGSFELVRNSAVHGDVDHTPADAFAALAIAHLIATTLDGATTTPDGAGHLEAAQRSEGAAKPLRL